MRESWPHMAQHRCSISITAYVVGESDRSSRSTSINKRESRERSAVKETGEQVCLMSGCMRAIYMRYTHSKHTMEPTHKQNKSYIYLYIYKRGEERRDL